MSTNFFWDKYDRHTASKSFFDINYRDFIPDLSTRDYDHIINTKLCEDLLDDFLNAIKLFFIQSFELISTAYTSEILLCSQKRLVKFMENVLEYVKIERLYLSYLGHPFKTGLPAGGNMIPASLLRFRCLLQDFRLIYGFSPTKESRDFENAKELICDFSVYFKKKLKQVASSYDSLGSGFEKSGCNNEYRIVLELISLCDGIAKLQDSKSTASSLDSDCSIKSSNETLLASDSLVFAKTDSPSLKRQMLHSLQIAVKKHQGLQYYPLMEKSLTNPDHTEVSQYSENCYEDSKTNKYNPKKYDRKEIKEIKQNTNTKNAASKVRAKEELSVTSIFNRRTINRSAQDMSILGIPETILNHRTSEAHDAKLDSFPVTYSSDLLQDARGKLQNAELLSLVNFDFDPNNGWKITTNQQQKLKLKQLADELDEQSKLETELTQRLPSKPEGELEENSCSEDEYSYDIEEEGDLNLREIMERARGRRHNLNTKFDVEFQEIETGLHVEPTIINNYPFYENTLLRYEKPDPEYLTRTEKVFERPTVDTTNLPEDYAFRQLSPKSSRRQFLASIYGMTY